MLTIAPYNRDVQVGSATQSTQMQTSYQEQQAKCSNQEAVNTKQKPPKKDTLYTLEIATLCTELRLQELETVQHQMANDIQTLLSHFSTVQHQMANDIQTLLSHFSAKSEQITPSGSASSTPTSSSLNQQQHPSKSESTTCSKPTLPSKESDGPKGKCSQTCPHQTKDNVLSIGQRMYIPKR